jgi:hypothetical protein
MMAETINKTDHYVNLLNKAYGIEISVEFNGLLGVVKEAGHIIFTTAGSQSSSIIEAYLMGFVTALTR